ncbi:MAG: polysaccharide export protein [Gammaproteobacteria bacterium]|nr:MAG: polysaccharide export protein [Gammaproteobacteria bacterium]
MQKYRLLGCLLLAGLVNTASASDVYRINAGDVLQVFVWNEEALNRDVLVGPAGTFRFPMVGEVRAGGSSASEVEQAIIDGLSNYLKDEPVVTVSLLSIDGNKIYVLGQVAHPGEFTVNRRIDVLQALALAGGLTAFAAENDIKILRRNSDGALDVIPLHYAKLKKGKELESDVFLRSGDVVIVP